MATLLLTHPASRDHVTPDGHPERVARIEAVEAALSAPAFDALIREEAPAATVAQIARAHPERYIEKIRAAVPATGFAALDADTHLSPGSFNAATHAAGANVAAIDAVMTGRARTAFAACRPPGHHTETETAMGFCLFGNVVIGARHALDAHGASKVAIIDFDVHHGNGTQALVWDDPRIFFASTHQSPLYPGTGASSERGAHDNVLNVPMPPLSDGTHFRRAITDQVLPAVAAQAPDLICLSAGFDAHVDDPLANLLLTEDDFAWVTREAMALANRLGHGRVVSTLEGGYDLDALAASTAAHVRALMERP